MTKKKHKHGKDRPRYVFLKKNENQFKAVYAKILGEGLAEIVTVFKE